MNPNNYNFAIIGGDLRQVYMANELIARNYSVVVYGLKDFQLVSTCNVAESLDEAVKQSQIIITPIPTSRDGINILSYQKQTDLTIEHLCSALTPNHKLYGGCLTRGLKSHCDHHNIVCYDLMEDEEVILFNTIATAEGTIAEAIYNSTTNLHGGSCLIIGFGRCARTLADKIKNLCGQVDIAARSAQALTAAYTASYGTLSIQELGEKIHQYNYIFNTVPSLVLTEELLANTNPNVVIIDIASAPGGVDFQYAKEINRNAKLCLGLPGKYAPRSSAIYLIDNIISNLGKK